MFKKLLLSLAALLLTLSASAETKVLWQSETEEGVKPAEDWKPVYYLEAADTKDIEAGDFIVFTVVSVNQEVDWPQVGLKDNTTGGWAPLKSELTWKEDFPKEIRFPVMYDEAEKFHANGISFIGAGAYIKSIALEKGTVEIGPNTVWFGPKACNWGDGVNISKDIFANVDPGDKIQVLYDKEAKDHTLQFLFGGWSGCNVATYEFGGVNSFNDDSEAGAFTLELTEELYNLKWGDNEVEYDLFDLLKTDGLIMQGPCTVKQVIYIPAPFEPSPDAVWVGPKQCNWGVAIEIPKDVFANVASGDKIIVEYDGKVDHTLQFLFEGWSGLNIPTYDFGKINSFYDKDGTFILELTEDLYNLKWGDNEYDLFDLLKNNGLLMQGPCTVKQIFYIPAPEEVNDGLFNEWSNWNEEAEVVAPFSAVNNIGKELTGSNTILGSDGVEGKYFADLTEYEGIEAEGTPGLGLRLLFNRPDMEGGSTPITECNATFDKKGKLTFLFSEVKDDYPYKHLNSIKTYGMGEDTNYTVTSITLIPKPDPVEVAKKALTEQVKQAKYYDSFAKTEESFDKLQQAISSAESQLTSDEVTVESLENAGKVIEGAINGLELAKGYENLTPFIFKNYEAVKAPGDVQNPGEGNVVWWACANELFKRTDLPYGGRDVNVNDWADLTEYDQLIITTNGETAPRILMNREYDTTQKDGKGIDGNTQEESNMLDMAPGNGKWSTQEYLTSEGNVYTVDLKKIINGEEGGVEGYGFAHLNAIKKSGIASDIFVTGMYLYKASDPLEMHKEALKEQIEKAKLYDGSTITPETFAVLQEAIIKAETELSNENATLESLEAAGKAIEDAIAGLTLAEGYEYLTADMFKRYASVEEPGEGTPTECAYDLFAAVNTPYGDGNVDHLNWADLSGYDKFIVKMGDKNTPRVMMNRMVAGGNDNEEQEQSQMLEMVPNSQRWSTKAYATYDEEENIFTIDLKKIVKEYGIARLNAIKYPWGVSGILTGLYLYKSSDPLEMPKEALKKDIEDAKLCDKYLKTDESLANLQAAIDAAEAELSNESATEESLAKASSDLADAIAGLTLQPGYSELTKEMFKKYASVTDPGEGEPTGCDFNLNVKSGSPYGDCNSVGYLNWADLTNYDKLIITATEGNQRFCMNRLADGGQQGASMEESEMLDIQVGTDSWSAIRYLESDGNVHTVDLTKMVDDYGFARLHTIKYSWGQDGIITNIYLYKDPEAPAEYSLSFNIDDPSHVVITVDGEEITDLVAGDNEKKIADRAKLSIAPAEEYILKTVTADGEDVTLKDGSLSKTIVKAFSFNITTDDADPLAKPKKALTAIIEAARLYDSYAKTEESFSALTDAIAAAETALESDEATEASLTTAGENVTKAIDGLKLKERYSYLTPEMFKQYASVEEPGEGEVTDCTFELFNTSRTLYGDVNNNPLKWADLSDFDELIIITKGVGDLPRFCIKNDSEGSLIEINPYDGSNDATEKYQTVNEDKTEFNVDLRKIAKDGKFAHLHSIQVNGWGTGAFVTGMYLYKRPFVAVTQVTLDQEKVTLVNGESVTLVATVAPEDATEPAVSWTSSNENVAIVDADGKVTAVGVGNVTITATAGDISAECAVKCNPQLGDATLDGSITITDAVDITNYVVKAKDVPEDWNEAEWREFYLLAANANKDEAGKITFADASATAELALKQPVAATMRAARRAAAYGYADSSDALVIGRVSNASYSKVTIPVSLENSMDYVALQADIILPEGMNIEVKAGERAAATHTLMTYKFADNHIRVALFNLGNNAFADNDAPILEIVADSYLSDCSGIVISNVLASDYKAHEYILDSRIGMSGVAGINGDNILISKAADGVVISNATGAAISIFTLDGKIIRSFVAKDDEEMINLSSGIYVVKAGDKTFKVVL